MSSSASRPAPRSARATPPPIASSTRLHDALPGIDAVVHVEPRGGDGGIRERVLAAALTVSQVREIHNLTVLDVDGSTRGLAPPEAPGRAHARPCARHRGAGRGSDSRDGIPEVAHRPDAHRAAEGDGGRRGDRHRHRAIEDAVREETGADPRELRFVRTDDGIVAFLTLGLGSAGSVADAHGRATRDRGARARAPSRPSPTSWYTPSRERSACSIPLGHPLERGWVGRVDGERVIQLAAQTLQSFFTGGGSAREHAEYPLAEVRLLAPSSIRPSVRVFDEQLLRVRESCGSSRPGRGGPGDRRLWRWRRGSRPSSAPTVCSLRSRSWRSGAIR